MVSKVKSSIQNIARTEGLQQGCQKAGSVLCRAAKRLATELDASLFYSKQQDVGACWGAVAAGAGMVGAAMGATAFAASTAVNAANAGGGNNRAAGGGPKNLSYSVSDLNFSESKISEMNVSELLGVYESN